MLRAQTTIDKQFGEGYAKEHPELLAAFMMTASQEHKTLVLEHALDRISNELSTSLDNVGTAVENVAGISDQLHSISECLWVIVGVSDNSLYLRVSVTQE